eukprot:CAMPEP_0114480154 /NCGR_PEP_ID=MMETSP0104-20121206/16977_1 /TAXON_ID=37642 ORGANISM="Paraphysomonas imperforata, Strain PA2" /NCGR_SAMPLE_ID=MMETSP0104 /ASSEMBLY_ACC=CAM_ASM_000202 /LENGTH=197 /DNA_ID=CAMNT_0001655613 /DNA_START=1 /DNA_END=590 /DNA_ORIENTATION=+
MMTNLNTAHSSWKDNMDDMDLPLNLKLIHTNYSAVVTLARKLGLFDFRLKASTPYKLCDFRPLFGVMYPELLEGFSHWGWTSVDLIMGDVMGKIQEQYQGEDVVYYTKNLYLNCITILKNSPQSKQYYQLAPNKLLRKVFHQTPDHPVAFDEDLLACHMQQNSNISARRFPSSDCTEGGAKQLWFYYRGDLFHPQCR